MTVIEMKPVRERILDAATRSYYADGIRAVSADRLIGEAHVSKATFYRYFPTKDHLIAAYLELRSAAEMDAVTEQRKAHPGEPQAVLQWYADLNGDVSCQPGFRGCPFINAAAELATSDHPARTVIDEHRTWLTSQVAELLAEMGIEDAPSRAEQLMMLRDGAMILGYLGRTPQSVTTSLVDAGRAVIGH